MPDSVPPQPEQVPSESALRRRVRFVATSAAGAASIAFALGYCAVTVHGSGGFAFVLYAVLLLLVVSGGALTAIVVALFWRRVDTLAYALFLAAIVGVAAFYAGGYCGGWVIHWSHK